MVDTHPLEVCDKQCNLGTWVPREVPAHLLLSVVQAELVICHFVLLGISEGLPLAPYKSPFLKPALTALRGRSHLHV